MRKMLLVLVLMTSACGGSSPTSPTVGAAAKMVMDGWGYDTCILLVAGQASSCQVNVTVRNQGPDCASAIRGTLHVMDSAGTLLTDVQYNFPTTLVLRLNETYQLSTKPSYVAILNPSATRAAMELFTTATHC